VTDDLLMQFCVGGLNGTDCPPPPRWEQLEPSCTHTIPINITII